MLKEVGEKLFLSLNVGEDLSGGFVSAFLYDENNNFLSQSDLSYVANGLFSESIETMPSVQKIVAVFKVFTDAARTEVNDEFPFVSLCFEQNKILNELSSFTPKGLSIQATVRKDMIVKSKVSMVAVVRAETRKGDIILRSKISSNHVIGNVRTKNIIKGVVYDV